MKQHDASDAADHAQEALDAVAAYHGGADEPAADRATDLLTDLMHWTARAGLDWDEIAFKAFEHFDAEQSMSA